LRFALFIGVDFDARLASIDFFGNDAVFGERLIDFLNGDIVGKVADVDGGVLAFDFGLFALGLLDLLCAKFLRGLLSRYVRWSKTPLVN